MVIKIGETLRLSCGDSINVTFLIEDHRLHAHEVILAVSIAAAFPFWGGVSAFHRFIERGYLPRQWSLETNMEAKIIDNMILVMISPLSFSTI